MWSNFLLILCITLAFADDNWWAENFIGIRIEQHHEKFLRRFGVKHVSDGPFHLPLTFEEYWNIKEPDRQSASQSVYDEETTSLFKKYVWLCKDGFDWITDCAGFRFSNMMFGVRICVNEGEIGLKSIPLALVEEKAKEIVKIWNRLGLDKITLEDVKVFLAASKYE
mmetsp:Transcript_14998/g.22695  ORF Transcript_14998/g.22695 Transcript_14998/m.22695 type:complete len:167 (+) Transcript_14998:135-635(+)